MILCDWNKTCENDEISLGLVFNTDAFPEVFSWKLVNSNETTLYEGGNYSEKYTIFEYKDCLVVPINDYRYILST